jgi:hypothetical protein
VFLNVLCLYKPFPTIYTIFTRSHQKFYCIIVLHFVSISRPIKMTAFSIQHHVVSLKHQYTSVRLYSTISQKAVIHILTTVRIWNLTFPDLCSQGSFDSEMSGFHGGKYEVTGLLGCRAMYSHRNWLMSQRYLLLISSGWPEDSYLLILIQFDVLKLAYHSTPQWPRTLFNGILSCDKSLNSKKVSNFLSSWPTINFKLMTLFHAFY